MSPAVLPRTGRRRAAVGTTACLVVAGLLLWWLLPADSAEPSGRVTFSTGVDAGVYEKYGKLLQRAASRDLPDLDIDLETSDGSQENVARVAQGRADFTIAAADAVEQYQLEGYPGGDRLRGCARLYDDYIQLVVPQGSDIKEAADLRGKRVAVGQDRSGVRLVADRVLKAAGLDLDKDLEAVASGIDEAPEHLSKGDVDAFFWSGGLPTSSVRELSERDDVRLVPLGSLVTELHKQGGASRYYRAAVMPADAYPRAQNSAVPTLAVANLLVTTVGQDSAVTQGLTRTVIDNRDHIGSKVHAAQLVDLRTAIYTDPLALHTGARDYYRSVKP
ncbi:ABC transporter, phosphonate, periplasmic substrate-binding protein [Streptomyces sp. YIM 130001]|uniref:TAXI family TRAP transporter solute-binding subunit n=1 Tax=Streptomyces sp. YIM 130001 TaxID=2259644 RepID=UPI000E65C84D|nr:TAXI family TRAP transporter solute-binding subunit [Streptomyces sp. YIM 130001]RII09471.1 ABC transporter, phosphonate, periplasmic substrate-binding protein [Streptomyces sp. YIM 130001]